MRSTLNKLRKVVDLEISMKFIKIAALNMNDKLDFVDLAIIWERADQSNETKGYELNYIECDCPMSEVFRRVSGFHQQGNGNWEEKSCSLKLVKYKHDENGRIEGQKGEVIADIEYEMTRHINYEDEKAAKKTKKKADDIDKQEFKNEDDSMQPWNKIKSVTFESHQLSKDLIGKVQLDFILCIEKTENCAKRA